jgi:hypothetical protein
MLNNILPEQVLFIDIETVSQKEDFHALSETEQYLWTKKSQSLKKTEEDNKENLYPRAAIYAEFGKIICIGMGVIMEKNGEKTIHVKCIKGHHEKELLEEFLKVLRLQQSRFPFLCAHNGREFDFPYLARRILINGLTLPQPLDVAGKKPWEVNWLDTMELWKFGDYKNYTSLELLAHVFNIPTPKDDIDGSEVGNVYWKEKNLDRIANYCSKDIVTLVKLFLKMKGAPEELKISFAE